jgi:hypothetical protein
MLETNGEKLQPLWVEFLLIPGKVAVVNLFRISKGGVKPGVVGCLR